MWNLKDSNKVVGIQNKVNSYKKHIKAIYSIKPSVKLQQPWKPSFSLSKFKNKYHKLHTLQLNRSNQTLINHLTDITNDSKLNTFLQIPKTIPSNKQTFKSFKSRQRKRQHQSVQKFNQKILTKIKSINSQYMKQNFDKNWKLNIKYKQNILKKQFNPDFFQLAKRSFVNQSDTSRIVLSTHNKSLLELRPKTAFAR